MRIVGGKHKGARLSGPKGRAIRPTSDRTREALFNILTHGIDALEIGGARVLDLFAGTGALGLEALSRDAEFCLFVEQSAEARGIIRQNAEAVGALGTSKIWRRDATQMGKLAPLAPFDLIFADPPYGKHLGEAAIRSLLAGDWLKPGAIVVLEEAGDNEIEAIAGLTAIDSRTYGDTTLHIFRFGGF